MAHEFNDRQYCLPDPEIVELYWKRNERAISETDKKYRNYLYRIAYNIVHDELDSEECLNDTYLGTWNTIPPTRPSVFQVFISKIMRNVAVDRYRKNSAKKNIPSELVSSLDELEDCIGVSSSVEEEYLIADLRRLLNDFLRSQGERAYTAFICRYYYADKIDTIAQILGVHKRTVMRELERMRQELRESLIREGYDYE